MYKTLNAIVAQGHKRAIVNWTTVCSISALPDFILKKKEIFKIKINKLA